MNETNFSSSPADVPWPTSEERARVPDTSMLPGIEHAPVAAAGVLNDAVHGAHAAIDRVADSVAPTVQSIAEGAAAAEEALQAKSDELSALRDEWVDRLRTTVRGNPLLAVAGAVALGLVVARVVGGRSDRRRRRPESAAT